MTTEETMLEALKDCWVLQFLNEESLSKARAKAAEMAKTAKKAEFGSRILNKSEIECEYTRYCDSLLRAEVRAKAAGKMIGEAVDIVVGFGGGDADSWKSAIDAYSSGLLALGHDALAPVIEKARKRYYWLKRRLSHAASDNGGWKEMRVLGQTLSYLENVARVYNGDYEFTVV